MNKKLIAVAVAGVFALPFAAQADSSNVTIYGIAHASIDMTKTGDTTTASGASRTKVSSNQSRIGFKGTEDLGNGMSAVWQLEEGFSLDGDGSTATGGGALASRNSFVGLSGKTWGTAILGRHDTPYKLATRGLDNFADSMADNRALMGTQAMDVRANDVIAYISPTMSGFHAAVAYVAGAETASNGSTKGDAWSAAGIYENGPLFASVGYQRFKYGSASNAAGCTLSPAGAVTCTTAATSSGSLGSAANSGKTSKAWKVGVGYTMDAFKVGFVYESITDDFATRLDQKDWTLNASYTMGANVLKAAYTRAGKQQDVADSAAKQISVGVDHNMSKRTSVYALYTKVTNDAGASYGVGTSVAGGAQAALGAGADPSAWSFGLKHSF